MKVYSIFKSINGEVSGGMQGRICSFIRLSGCNLATKTEEGYNRGCIYCDTSYAFDTSLGKNMSIKKIIAQIKKQNCSFVTITGGEPLLQKVELEKLVLELDLHRYFVSIETNGSIPVPSWSSVHSWVVDYKLSNSGVNHRMKLKNFNHLTNLDFVKFVIGQRDNFDEALSIIPSLPNNVNLAFSPEFNMLKPDTLLKWMKEANLNNAILNVQLHKLLNLTEDK